MYQLSIIVGKLLLLLLRLSGRHGTALPGLVVEKINRRFLKSALGELEHGMVVVTGTNGKTTTTKIISELAAAQGLKVLTNKSGGNFVRGIISATLENASWGGNLDFDLAVFEQDEAHAARLVKLIQPRGVVALNIMRDQMDRFGEIDTTAKLVGKVVAAASSWVVLNANDPRVGQLAEKIEPAKTHWFGHSKDLLADFVTDDQHHHREGFVFYEAVKPTVELSGMDADTITLKRGREQPKMKLALDGGHNAINAAAAVAAVSAILPRIKLDDYVKTLQQIEPAFGRGERIMLKNGAGLRIQLVKNPSGFTHSLRLLKDHSFDAIGILINDDFPDGRDVSWLWDVEFGLLKNAPTEVSCGGTRGWDMALRLKYDDVQAGNTTLDLTKFTKRFTAYSQPGDETIIFCTYTAMLSVRKQLAAYSPDVKGAIL